MRSASLNFAFIPHDPECELVGIQSRFATAIERTPLSVAKSPTADRHPLTNRLAGHRRVVRRFERATKLKTRQIVTKPPSAAAGKVALVRRTHRGVFAPEMQHVHVRKIRNREQAQPSRAWRPSLLVLMNSVAQEKRGSRQRGVSDDWGIGVGSRDPKFIVAVVGSLLLMGSSFIVGKALLQDDFPPLLLVGWRFLLAALIALPLILIFSQASLSDFVPPHFGVRNYATITAIGLLQTTAAMGLLYLAMRRVSATTAAVLMFTNPIWVVIERLFLHEAAIRGRVLGLILRTAGVLLAIKVGRDGFSSSGAVVGDVIGIGAACCWAAATLLQRRAGLPMGPWVLHFWQGLAGAVVLILIADLGGEHWPSRMTATQVGCLLWLAIPASVVSFGLWLFALGRGGQTHTSGLLFCVPLVAAVLSHFVLHTRLTGWQAVGGVLIGMSVWLDSRCTAPEFVPPP